MIEMIENGAKSFSVADLGLHGRSLDFARALLKAQGGAPATESDMAGWATIVDEERGLVELRFLEALGIVESVPTVGEVAVRAFNPLAERLLA